MLSIIVAIAKNNVIGKDNKLIWHIPEDLKRFKRITTGKTIIMGRNTFLSLGRVLPERKHVVLTHLQETVSDDEQVKTVYSLDDLKEYIENDEENFVIGGAMMYKTLMPYANKMYITEIDQEFEGDVYFPEIDKNEWKEVERTPGLTDVENNSKISKKVLTKYATTSIIDTVESCRCSSMVEPQPSKLMTRVRFPLPAPNY